MTDYKCPGYGWGGLSIIDYYTNGETMNQLESKTVKQLLTEPFRVQKKQGYYTMDTFRQGLLNRVYKLDDSIGSLSNIECYLAIEELRLAAERAHEVNVIEAVNAFLSIRESINFFLRGGMIRYLDGNLSDVLAQTIPPKSVIINNRLKFKTLFLMPPSKSSLHFLILRKCEVGLAYSIFRQKQDGLSHGYFGVLPLDKPVDTYCEEYKDYTNETTSTMCLFYNFLLWQQSMHDKGEDVITLDAPTRQMGFAKKSKQIIIPQVIGGGYKPKVIRNYESTGTHASPQTHWRSGHWRQQPHGSKEKPDYKTIWIEPVLVNA